MIIAKRNFLKSRQNVSKTIFTDSYCQTYKYIFISNAIYKAFQVYHIFFLYIYLSFCYQQLINYYESFCSFDIIRHFLLI
jgi:hypothetical protein